MTKSFSELGLSEPLLKAVEKMGYEQATAIQRQAIPLLLEGTDVVGQSQTGSGKTAAFALPAIEHVDAALKKPQVLVLCPTRELAMQVAGEVAKLAQYKRGVRELPIYGGQSYERQLRGIRDGAQIIIGTPGRVMDHLQRHTLKLDHLKMVVLDEADRMLDMGFCEDIEQILSQAPAKRQTVFFSATLPAPIKRLIGSFSKNPTSVKVEKQEMVVPKIEQQYYEVDRRSKLDVLCRLIDVNDISYGIIFCATKLMVDDLTEALNARGYPADKLHGDISQNQRERVVERFRNRRIEFLVATDVAARGLDIDDVQVVFNFDLPHDGEDYVHRIGRTGRAGKTGRAITFVAGREIYRLQNIVRFTGAQIKRARVPTVEEVGRQRENQFFNHLRDTLEAGAYKRYDHLIDRLLEQQYSPTDIASALIDHINGGKGAPTKPTSTPAPIPEKKAPEHTPEKSTPQRPPEPSFQESKGPVSALSDNPKMTRLLFNVGRDHQVQAAQLSQIILVNAKIAREKIGDIFIRTKRSYVDIANKSAATVIKSLEGVPLGKRKLKVQISRE